MGGLVKLAAWLLSKVGGAGEVRAATIRMTIAALCAGLAALLMLVSLGCMATALWIFTLPSLGPAGAPLVVAATLSALALMSAAAVWLIMRRRRRGAVAATASPLLLSDATRLFNEHKVAILLAAVVAGMAAAKGGHRP